MCNDYRYSQSPDTLFKAFSDLKVPARWAGDTTPNYPPLDDIRIGDVAPIVTGDSQGVAITLTPWAWKSANGKPVFNFRSEGRSFAKSARCLIPADGFYEFTKPHDPKSRLKDKHLFNLRAATWFWIAGIVREGAFTMLTTSPGPDVAPYHDRQIVVLPREAGMAWLDLSRPEEDLLRPLVEGSLKHLQVR